MKTVLVAVLDWGLGHATRCIPIIHELKRQQARVLIAGNGGSLELLKQEFPELKYVELPTYGIHYPQHGSMAKALMLQLPRIWRVIRQEKQAIQKIVEHENVNAIISDNRYGCFSKSVRSVVVCHQLNIQMPKGLVWASAFVNGYHHRLLKRFETIWIPDMPEGLSLSGSLSIQNSLLAKRVGILSRFGNEGVNLDSKSYEIVAIISGPEPQRTIFEDLARIQLQALNKSALLVKGLPGQTIEVKEGNLTEINHLKSNELEPFLMNAKVVISRAGYSTIMDLTALGKRAILIPTPGQSEQEYLARYLSQKHWIYTQHQDQLNLVKAIDEVSHLNPMPHIKPNVFLPEAIKTLLC